MSEPKSMGKFHPGLLNDWDYVNNTDIDPMRVSTSSTEVVHWLCAKCGRRWEASISDRVQGKADCPIRKYHYMPEGFYRNGKYDAEIMEEVGRKVIHLLEEIYGRKASPEIWALNNFKEFEIWYDANKKELEANARKKGPKGKTAAKMAA